MICPLSFMLAMTFYPLSSDSLCHQRLQVNSYHAAKEIISEFPQNPHSSDEVVIDEKYLPSENIYTIQLREHTNVDYKLGKLRVQPTDKFFYDY